jgi:hypothetical protein
MPVDSFVLMNGGNFPSAIPEPNFILRTVISQNTARGKLGLQESLYVCVRVILWTTGTDCHNTH